MGIAARKSMIAALELTIKQLESMECEYVSGEVDFKTYRETLPVKEVLVEYMARDQRTASLVSVKVGEITEVPQNKGGRTLNLPYRNSVFQGGQGYGPDLAPEAIMVVQEHHGDHKAWLRLEGQEQWITCQGFAKSWSH